MINNRTGPCARCATRGICVSNHEEHQQMVTDCENRESKLTDWERQFVDSIGHQLADGRALTDKQSEALNTIWDRVT